MKGAELAEVLGISEATVSRLLSGDRRPSVDLMVKIKDVFPGWSLDDQAIALETGEYGAVLRNAMDSKEKTCECDPPVHG